jgi:predicted restriction endonuclease
LKYGPRNQCISSHDPNETAGLFVFPSRGDQQIEAVKGFFAVAVSLGEEVYDYRCAACGIRVLLDHVESLVEAAHLIPFSESRNDKPTNGMALCPNHHWAMDRHLIAPCPDSKRRAGIWRVNEERLASTRG